MRSEIQRSLTIVLVLDHAFVSGGQSKVAFDSAVGLKRAGHQPIIFAAVGPVAPELADADIPVVCLDQNDLVRHPSPIRAAVQGIWNEPARAALSRLLGELPADRTIIHVHGWAKALSPSIAKAIADSGLPAVYTMHEYSLLCPNGGLFNYPRQQACHLKPLSAACWASRCDSRSYSRKLWRNVRSSVMTYVAHLPDVFSDIICISDFQHRAIASMLPPRAKVHLVANPIATSDLGPKPEPASGEIMFIGRISPEKGPFIYAEAARRIGAVPVFVGDGPLKDEIAARYPEARMIAWQDHASVREHMRRARALVFPSLWYEGQPLTVLEALSLGTPVLVSDGCAGRDSVLDGISGLWFRNGDAGDLARAMIAVADDEVATRLSQGAYDRYWAEPPTLERHTHNLLAIYGGLVAREGAPAEGTDMRAA